MGKIWEKVAQGQRLQEQVSIDDCDNKRCASTQFTDTKKSSN